MSTSAVKSLTATASMTPELTAHLDVKAKGSGSNETITWGGKTYKITVMKKGQVSNPTTRAEWDKLKEEHKAFLSTIDKVETFQGAKRIRYSSSAKSLTVFEAGKDKRVIDLDAVFKNEKVSPEAKAAYERLSTSVQTIIFKSFTSTVPLKTKKPGTDSAVNDAQTNAERAARLESANECLQDGDVVSYLEQLQKANNRLAFAYVSPLNEAKQPVPLNFVSHFQAEYIKNTALQTNSDTMIFAMPYLVDATPAQAGHYKLVLINFADSTISHYDSLGYAPNAAVKVQLALLAAELSTKYARPFLVADQGNTVHQTDGTSCGHLVLNCVAYVLAGRSPVTYMSVAAPIPSELAELKQGLANFYRKATSPAPVIPTSVDPANSRSSNPASTTTPAALSTPAPVTTENPPTLISFESIEEDEKPAPKGVLGTIASYWIPQRFKNWWSGSGSNENSVENSTPYLGNDLTDF